ncbi:DNA-processing protein DprA [Luteipulveratus mongoliensis]|uniref:Smf/DprA SLOG domain-containing protein n=1 Tax=Luteipulveratus mongoliensis TaxID=571913 RepID=A0A0K1JI56_9MICO|nr:DNA-processing protein DprA [Luteipulveratus mongoliensis]AKU16404.1 hypothetical protein VV02_11915 [Luteipulveratus mongoliensis]
MTTIEPGAVDPLAAERAARMTWARLVEPREDKGRPLIAEHGHLGALARVRHDPTLLGRAAVARLTAFDLSRELRAADLVEARVLIPGDPEWPLSLDDLALPPHCLWVRGPADLRAVTERSAAVVGARTASAYGRQLAAEISAGLAGRGFTIISGAAFGIDAAAHHGALAVDGLTVAALACGIDRAYPAAHTNLLKEILERGAVVTEMPPGSAPIRTRFLDRNRVIAALSLGTVVVEAGLRSGSLNTARHAAECGRYVGAVPGPVTSVTSAGTHELIRTREAELVTDAAEVAELLGVMGDDLAPARRGPDRPEDRLGRKERTLWEALPASRGAPLSRLVEATGMSASDVLQALGSLNLIGMAVRDRGGWRKPPEPKLEDTSP